MRFSIQGSEDASREGATPVRSAAVIRAGFVAQLPGPTHGQAREWHTCVIKLYRLLEP